MRTVSYVIAPAGWTQDDPNPFTADGAYGPRWSCFRIRDDHESWAINRTWDSGLYALVVGRCFSRMGRGMEETLADFLRYETSHGRRVILSAPPDIEGERLAQRALAVTPDGPVVRPTDRKWLVHSTPAGCWERIRACGELRSLARLRREGCALPGVGLTTFGEPKDYAEHVMLGVPGAMGSEFVVASQMAGAVITEPGAPYEPGARLFFDGFRLVRDGLIVRDGLHIKIHDHLPLAPYMVASVTPADVDPDGLVRVWTPRAFCLASLRRLSATVGEDVPYEDEVG